MFVDKSFEDTPEAFPLRLMKEVAEMSSSACEDFVLPPHPPPASPAIAVEKQELGTDQEKRISQEVLRRLQPDAEDL